MQTMQENGITGKHLIVEAIGSEQHLLNDEKLVKESLIAAANAGNFTVFELTTKKFVPRGVTGHTFSAESHIIIHTWPEYNYVAIDILTFGERDPMLALNELKTKLMLEKIKITRIARGKTIEHKNEIIAGTSE